MDDITLRPYAEGDEAAINDGFNRTFGLTRTLDEWRWKFPASPEGRWIMLAVDGGGRVLAHYGAVVAPMRLGPVTVRGAQIVDAYAARLGRRRDALGHKVFTNCYEEFIRRFGAREGLPFMFGFPGGRHFEMGIKVLHYEVVGPVEFWARGVGRRTPLWLTGHRVRRGFDREAVDGLWRRCAHRYPYATVRDGSWLERRFTSRPGVAYEHLSARRAGIVRAWAVVCRAGDVLQWADLLWDGEDSRALAALVRAVDARARTARCRAIHLWLGGDVAAGATLSCLGFESMRQPDGLHTLARVFHPEIDLDLVRRRLYLTLGDSDLI